VIVSYALLQQDAAELGAHSWSTAVLDEAQFIKNALSLRAKAAFALNAQYRLALTGTPVENHLGDLWSIFHFLNPALLGGWKHFQLRFLKPIERENDQEQRSQLRTLLQPFLLRRRKDEVLSELPPLTVIRHDVQLNDDENRRYAILRREIHEKLRTPWGKRQHRLQIFAEITRLRRFCCHPRLVFPDASYESSKLDAFLELVEELRDNGHSALVFSQFVDFLGLVREQLDERRLRYLYLDGSTPKEQRSRLVSEFQAGGVGLFLISLKAGGFGLNLTAADYVIHLDPWWNPAVEAQASDRAHRIGQDRPVTVYRLITRDTIEESILSLHGEKRALAEAVLEGTASAGELDVEQLLQLLEPAPSL
jgi:SNF2 family DNA or RNA helicase